MTPAPSPAAVADTPAFARAVLDAATQVDAAETRIKDALLAAARSGDMNRVITIVERWQRLPAAEVLD